MFNCPENSSFCLKLELLDKVGDPLSPIDHISWWVGKPREEQAVILETNVTSPVWDLEIVIPKEANICSGKRDEPRFIIVKVVSGLHVKCSQFDYMVKNLGLVPYPEGEE